jgi:hypothetical protein
MLHPQSPWPSERPEQLAEALHEQGATLDELAELLPAVQRLSQWQAPQPSLIDTQRLLARLAPELPALSPVRQAIRAQQQRHGASLYWLLTTARAQISLFGPAFWLVSALVTLLGAVAVLSGTLPNEELLLRASGPFLAYLGTIIAFRGAAVRALECELACLPSPVQLALARLVIVLGYDVGLGLSLRLSIQAAASVAYGSWLAVLAIDTTSTLQALPLTQLSDMLLGGIGLALLAIVLLRIQPGMHRLLPRA